ncbi:coiled-coil domain-containing protein [Pelobacter propionicus]|uniref:Uncharacterized protein n=1 Tax=Pelobacter propionicus (strain DSM 2379 / NBRC 103807 / OttBd1) TaxID=338966 RepID=A1AMJ4_PELPD|nr:hypothetical protein [Pelobacter propionicus]ABK98564.1 hypothetical protein Ppro_0935 [Pelobacter propionicus DSM 2379]
MEKVEYRVSIKTIKDILIIVLILVVGWNLLKADFSISFGQINSSELLSLLLALFAIGLSVAFYVKANKISNMFYDNMYKFTKQNSELLGRIEAGFGEQLRHLDEGYSGLRERFDMLPIDLAKTKARVEDEKAEVKQMEQERDKLLEELAIRANLENAEKEAMFAKLKSREIELQSAKNELSKLQMKLRDAVDEKESGVPLRAIKHTKRAVLDKLGLEDIAEADDATLMSAWNLIKDELSRPYMNDLRRSGIAEKNGELTEEGLQFIKLTAREVGA